VLASLGEQYPTTKGRHARLIDLATFTVGNSQAPLHLLLYAVLALMGIGCVNLAGLLLARGVRLEREVAVRAALGAGRWRLVQQLLAENLLYAVAGGALGVALTCALLRATRLLITASLARGAEAQLNETVLMASLAVSVVISLLAGLWPAVRLSGRGFTTLRSGGPRRDGPQSASPARHVRFGAGSARSRAAGNVGARFPRARAPAAGRFRLRLIADSDG